MKRGTIYLYMGFTFPDGQVKDKFFIILNTPLNKEYFITCITTSQQKWRADREGCHNLYNFYVLRDNYDFFAKKTWVLFDEYYPMSKELLSEYITRGIITKKAEFREKTIRTIINCVSNSEDISGLYKSMINR